MMEKWDPGILPVIILCVPILRMFGKIHRKFVNIVAFVKRKEMTSDQQFWEVLAKFMFIFRKCLPIFSQFGKKWQLKRNISHLFTNILVEKGSFIYQRGEDGNHFRGTSPMPQVNYPVVLLPYNLLHWVKSQIGL